MKRWRQALPRRTLTWLVVVGAAALLHAVVGRIVSSGDIIADVLSGARPGRVLLALALLLLRLFLYFLAPGWALYIAVRGALERRLRSRVVQGKE